MIETVTWILPIDIRMNFLVLGITSATKYNLSLRLFLFDN